MEAVFKGKVLRAFPPNTWKKERNHLRNGGQYSLGELTGLQCATIQRGKRPFPSYGMVFKVINAETPLRMPSFLIGKGDVKKADNRTLLVKSEEVIH